MQKKKKEKNNNIHSMFEYARLSIRLPAPEKQAYENDLCCSTLLKNWCRENFHSEIASKFHRKIQIEFKKDILKVERLK